VTRGEKAEALKKIDARLKRCKPGSAKCDALLDERLEVMHTRCKPTKPTFHTDAALGAAK
jgi:hypothetical protein